MTDLLFFGIQGSGKGTQGELLASKYNFRIFEMGSRLREIAQQDSALGEEVRVINKGMMVSDTIVFDIVKDFLLTLTEKDRVIFDGLPRTVEQYNHLKIILQEHNRDYTGVLIEINKKHAVQRIVDRRLCPQCKRIFSVVNEVKECPKCFIPLVQREDDKDPLAIQKRIDGYLKLTHPVTTLLRKENKLIEINGEQEILEVFYEMEKKLQEYHVL